MFDPVTAALLRSAPAVEGINPEDLPGRLAGDFAYLAASRLRANLQRGGEQPLPSANALSLARLADTYELIASIHDDSDTKRAAAFVSATAQQLLALSRPTAAEPPLVTRDRLDPTISATLLFLAAEQFADAQDASRSIVVSESGPFTQGEHLALSIRDYAQGNLAAILERLAIRPTGFGTRGTLEERATHALLAKLNQGIEVLAAQVLNVSDEDFPGLAGGSPFSHFSQVLEAASAGSTVGSAQFQANFSYPGPRHLASLLLAVAGATGEAGLSTLPPPPGANHEFWGSWLRHRAKAAPFLWINHREAISCGFHVPGTSATIVLPTGAGKSTIAYLKIAATVAADKKVIFLAPTHALVDQLVRDLAIAFPQELLSSSISSDFDLLYASGTTFRPIQVMTPERCLALLSSIPHAFEDVGLLVFDECHMLSPTSGLRRSIDGMLCVLGFAGIAPDADFLFLSAMLQNGQEFSKWIGELTHRNSVFVEALWKPSRQARGVVLYRESEIRAAVRAAQRAQLLADQEEGRVATTVRQSALRTLKAEPLILFGLQHNWMPDSNQLFKQTSLHRVSEGPLQLGAKRSPENIAVTPNANSVAAHLAESAVRSGLKVIVFVNTREHAVSTARHIRELLQDGFEAPVDPLQLEAIEAELDSVEHSLLTPMGIAQPHSAQMLPTEREAAEHSFQSPSGAMVLVATPTLAQGLNLPADVVIMAGDMRAAVSSRTPLEAHEVINAAGRAGRAGHVSNGLVILVPEPVAFVRIDGEPGRMATAKLERLFPIDDRCLNISDPLQVVLDRISNSNDLDEDVEYVLDRFAANTSDDQDRESFLSGLDIRQSLAAFHARTRKSTAHFEEQLAQLRQAIADRPGDTSDLFLVGLASQTGISLSILEKLRNYLLTVHDSPPQTVAAWLQLTIDWLHVDTSARTALLHRDLQYLRQTVGKPSAADIEPEDFRRLTKGLTSWIQGRPLREIEIDLGGNPAVNLECPQARVLITRFVLSSLPFVAAIVARVALADSEESEAFTSSRSVLECLPFAVRRGLDSPSKVAFAYLYVSEERLSRVQIHSLYAAKMAQHPIVFPSDGYEGVLDAVRALLAAQN